MSLATLLLILGAALTITGGFLSSKEQADLQLELNNQITGGKNKPVITFGFEGSGKRDFNSKSNSFSPMKFENKIIFYVINEDKKFPLKDVIVSVRDKYRIPNEVKDVSYVPYNLKGQNFNLSEIGEYFPVRLGALPPVSRKLFYISDLPVSLGNDIYVYEIAVEWSNGYYYMDVEIKEESGNLSMSKIDYYIEGGMVDPEKYFGRKSLIPTAYNKTSK